MHGGRDPVSRFDDKFAIIFTIWATFGLLLPLNSIDPLSLLHHAVITMARVIIIFRKRKF